MTLQVNVIVFGVTLVVAVGSIIYNLMVHKRQAQRISYDRPLPPPRAPDGEQ